MKIDILTLFPEMFEGVLSASILKRARGQEKVSIKTHNFRDWTTNKHRSVDDTPYGGGAGMVIRVDILVAALEDILQTTLPNKSHEHKVFLMSAKGQLFTQLHAQRFAKLNRLVLIAGHYEGVDERILAFIDGELSIGNFVLTGGELPAMMIADAVTRLLPGVISQASLIHESHSEPGIVEYPQYTRPKTFRGHIIPEVLLSGNHAQIADWRTNQQKKS